MRTVRLRGRGQERVQEDHTKPLQRTYPSLPGDWMPRDEGCGALTDADRAFVLRHTGLVVIIGRKLGPKGMEDCDLLSFALPAVVRAGRLYDLKRGCTEATYVWRVVQRHFISYRPRCQFFRPGNTGGCKPATPKMLNPVLMGEKDVIEEIVPEERESSPELIAQVGAAFANLKPRWREILTAYLGLEGEPRTLESVAEEYGISRQRVLQVVNHGLYAIARECGLPKHKIGYFMTGRKRMSRGRVW